MEQKNTIIPILKTRLKVALERAYERSIPLPVFTRDSGVNKDILAILLAKYGNNFEFEIREGEVYIKLRDRNIIDSITIEAENLLSLYYSKNEQ